MDAACQQRKLTPPDTWSCPTLGLSSVLMLRPISPELFLGPDFWVSNIPRFFCFASIERHDDLSDIFGINNVRVCLFAGKNEETNSCDCSPNPRRHRHQCIHRPVLSWLGVRQTVQTRNSALYIHTIHVWCMDIKLNTAINISRFIISFDIQSCRIYTENWEIQKADSDIDGDVLDV